MRKYILFIWTILDPLYYHFTRLTYIHSAQNGINNIFRVRLTSYRGSALTLTDNTEINKHDTLVKIHLHNIRLINDMKNINNDIHKARHIYKAVQESLPGVATYILSQRQNKHIKGIVGITTLNKGCERLGFETCELKNPLYKWIKLIPFISINMLSTKHPTLRGLKKKKPQYIFMSKDRLLQMYKQQTTRKKANPV